MMPLLIAHIKAVSGNDKFQEMQNHFLNEHQNQNTSAKLNVTQGAYCWTLGRFQQLRSIPNSDIWSDQI